MTVNPATEESQQTFRVIGTRPVRHDGLDKVLGRAVYGPDIQLPGLLHGAVLRSPHAHARIRSIDASRAEQAPGVLAVMTGADIPRPESRMLDLGEDAIDAKFAADRLMAGRKALFRGHPVAAVAATDSNTALEALELIDVEYEVLEPVLTLEAAMAPDAPLLHEDLVGDHVGERVPHTNVAKISVQEAGDPEEGFAQAAVVLERDYALARVHQGYIEPQNATALWGADGHLRIWCSTQGAFGVRERVAEALQVPESRVHVTPLEIGGGFGGKIDIYLEPLAAVLSRKSGRPVKLVMDRKSVFEATGPAPGGRVRVKLGVDDEGRITAATADIRYGAGAYPGSAIGAAMNCIFACYRVPNLRITAFDVLLNLSRSAAYRAPGAPQVGFAMEALVDEVCEAVGMDPLEFRLLNGVQEGDRRGGGPRYPRIGYLETVRAIKESPHYNAPLERHGPDGRLRGRGAAGGFWSGIGGSSTVTLNVNSDGTVSLVEGSTDIGGTRASIAMQAAEVLGIAAEDVRPHVADTDSVGFTGLTGGSRTTYATGEAAVQAARKVVDEMKARAAFLWETEAANVEFEDGVFTRKETDQRLTLKEVAAKLQSTGGPVSATAALNKRGGGGGSFSSQVADVEVDPETGKVDVIRYTVAQDVGRAVHPSYAEGQLQGGVAQGIGWALHEEYVIGDEGEIRNASFLDYRMPTALDVPSIETILVEVPNASHPFGVRGIGETSIVPPAPAIANALHDALGIRFYRLPMSPGRVLDALRQKTGHTAGT